MVEFAFRPASGEFPLLDKERLEELVEDLQANGQIEPIRLYCGQIVDGRNRYLACRKAGIEPRVERLPDDVNPFAYVWSLNGQRRDLTQDQRYLIWKSCAAKSGDWETEWQRLQEEANRARSSAGASRPRTEDGVFSGSTSASTSCGRTGSRPRGQRILFERLTLLCPATVLIVEGDAESMTVNSIRTAWRGTISEPEEADIDALRTQLRTWSQWAMSNSAISKYQKNGSLERSTVQ